jgi:esterase/lipase superfamily enzyme
VVREIPYRGKLRIELGIISVQSENDSVVEPYLALLESLSETGQIGADRAAEVARRIEKGLDFLVDVREMKLAIGLTAEPDSSGIWVLASTPAQIQEGLKINEEFEVVDAAGVPITNLPYVVVRIDAAERPSTFFQLPYILQAQEDLMDLVKEGSLNVAERDAFPYFRRVCLTSPDLLERDAGELVKSQETQMRQQLRTHAVKADNSTRDLRLKELADPTPAADKAEYLVWYGTNRRPIDQLDHNKGYSSERDEVGVVHYGSCRVFIPRSHKIGSIGEPWWKQLLKVEDDRLTLTYIQNLDRELYWAALAESLAATEVTERDAVIFVHGYNVSFEEAALRAAQIGFDLSVRGAMAFFAWPSRGLAKRYIADEATIEASEAAITDFISDFGERSGAPRVHIIAHSMGNRGVLRAVNRIAIAAQQRTGRLFDHIILAAPDVDADTFRQLANAYSAVANRTTLYVSRRDRAVGASRWLHDFQRAGLMPPVVVLRGIDTVNVTDVDLTWLGHGYVASARAVLADIHALIKQGLPPEKRMGLRQSRNERGELYWLIGA